MVRHRADAIDADLGILGLAVSQPPVQPFDFLDDHRPCRGPFRVIGRQTTGNLLQMLEPHGDMEPCLDGPLVQVLRREF
jgi:hypothetical protein